MQPRNDTAFALLHQLLESPAASVHPDAIRYSGSSEAYLHLVELGAVCWGNDVQSAIQCSWCSQFDLTSIRFGANGFEGHCIDCGWQRLSTPEVFALKVDANRIVRWLSGALGLAGRFQAQELVRDRLWRLGEMEHRRKRRIIFFGKCLTDPETTQQLRSALAQNCAAGCGVLITTSDIAPADSTFNSVSIAPLKAIAHLRKAGFVIENFSGYLEQVTEGQPLEDETTLRTLKAQRGVLIEGQLHKVSPQILLLLEALISAGGEYVHKRDLADALEMDIDVFKPAQIFKRHKAVLDTFVQSDGKGCYRLKNQFVE